MPEKQPHHYATDEIVNVETRHEESDVNVRALIWFAVIFVVFAIVTHLVIWFFFQGLAKSERSTADKTAPLSEIQRAADAAVPKNQPLLQPFPKKLPEGVDMAPNADTPVIDLAKMRAAEKQVLDNYGWVDRQRGVVRVPIEKAKELVVQRGLPVQSQLPPPPPAAQTPVIQQPVPGGAQ
jgi:hypothetical protein